MPMGDRGLRLLMVFYRPVDEATLRKSLDYVAQESGCAVVISYIHSDGDGVTDFLRRNLKMFEMKNHNPFLRFERMVSSVAHVVEASKNRV
jgi:hypothetical protein